MQVDCAGTLNTLSPAYRSVLECGRAESFYLSPAWLECIAATTREPDERLHVYGVRNGSPLAVAVCRTKERRSVTAPRSLSLFHNLYSARSGPVVTPEAKVNQDVFGALIGRIATETPAWDVVQLSGLAMEDASRERLNSALVAVGMRTRSYFDFGNWYTNVAGVRYSEYLAKRPADVRATIRRRKKKLSEDWTVRYEMHTDHKDIESAIADYHRVYRLSWKTAEPYPYFAPSLMRRTASDGTLRLGLLYLDDVPVATQLSVVDAGRAYMLKTAYRESHRHYSVGTLILAHLLEYILDVDHVNEVDFGYGDDPFKSLWMDSRRERWAITAFNQHTMRGTAGAMWHIDCRAAKHAFDATLRSRLKPVQLSA